MDAEEANAEMTVTLHEPIRADVDVLKFVSLALVQNGLPALQGLRVSNETDETMKDVVCAFSSDDGFIVPSQLAFKEICRVAQRRRSAEPAAHCRGPKRTGNRNGQDDGVGCR